MHFRSANNAQLAVGDYVINDPEGLGQPTQPALNINSYADCTTRQGRFQIRELVKNTNGQVTSLAVDFEKTCSTVHGPTYFGQLRFNNALPIDTTRRAPNAVLFQDQLNVAPGSAVVSNVVTLAGLDVPLALSISGGEYSLNGGPYSTTTVTAIEGDTVRVRMTAPIENNRFAVATLKLNNYITRFRVTTSTGTSPQPANEPLVRLFGLPQLNGTSKTTIFSPGTLQNISLQKSPYYPERGIRVSATPYDFSANSYYPSWSIELAAATGRVVPGQQTNLAINNQSSGAFFIANNADPTCTNSGNVRSANVNVHEIVYDALGNPTTLAMDYVLECDLAPGGYSRIYGHVRFNSSLPIDYSIKNPIPFNFPGIKDATPNTVYSSAVGAAQGITEPVAISVVGGEYSVDNGAFRSDASTINNGQSVKVRLISASTPDTLKTAVLKMGGVEYPFRVGTSPDAAPQPTGAAMLVVVGVPMSATQAAVTKFFSTAQLNRFVFSPSNWGNKSNQLYIYSSPDTNPTPSVIASGTVSGSNGTYLSPGTFELLPNLAGNSVPSFDLSTTPGCYFYGTASRKLAVHEVEYGANDMITKLAADVVSECIPNYNADSSLVYHYLRFNSTVAIDYTRSTPAPFEFSPALGVAPSSTQTSAAAAIYGINTAVPIAISGGEYAIGNGAFTNAPGLITNDQALRLRGVASATSDTLSTVTVTVGGRSASFKIGTAPAAKPQPRADAALLVMYTQSRGGALTQRVLSEATLFAVAPTATSPNVASWTVKSMSGNALNLDANITFAAGTTDLVPGTYLVASGAAGGNSYTISGYSYGNLPWCNLNYYYDPNRTAPRTIKFTVHEIERTVTGQMTKFAADIADSCEYDLQSPASTPTAAVFSFIRINSTVPISHAITSPVPVAFAPLFRQIPSATVESNAVTILGITEPIAVSSGVGNPDLEFSIEGGAFTATPANVTAGQTLKLRTKAPASANAFATSTINIGDAQASLFVGTDPGFGPNANGNPLVYLVSQGSEYLGQGNTFQFAPSLQHRIVPTRTVLIGGGLTGGEILRIEVFSPNSSYPDWSFDFSGINYASLVLGTYDNAQFDPSATAAKLAVNYRLAYRACQTLGPGSKFIVRELETAAASINKLAIDFVNYCPNNPDPLYGYIRINSAIAITPVADSDPTPFSIPAIQGVLRDTLVTSVPIQVSGFTVATPVSITGGEYSLNNGAFTSAPGIMNPGQSLRVRVLSAPTFSSQATATITVGSRSSAFVVTTGQQDLYPDSLQFATVDNAPRNSAITSAIAIVNDINDAVTVSAYSQGIQFSVAGQPFTTNNTILQPGQSLQLRLQSASSYSALTNGSVIVGQKTVYFSVRTGSQAVIVANISGSGTVAISPLNLNCSATCSSLLDQGTAVTLTAVPNAGMAFTGWSGAGCSGTGVCNITVDLTASVTATFAALPPAAPGILQAVAGNGSALFRLAPPSFAGGAPVSGYTVTCMPGSISASANATTITVTGLANGTAFDCSATANNSAGASAASNTVTVAPSAAITLSLNSVKSRKTHGTNQVHEIDVDPSVPQAGAITVEPRNTGAAHQLVFQFNAAVSSVTNVTAIDEANNSIAIADQSMSGNELRVTLLGALDKKRVKISLTGVNGALDASASIGFLLGDVGMVREVTQAAASAIKSRTGQAASLDNFIYDINLSGTITAADVVAVRRRVGNKLP
jgi:hypothetical protein